MTKLLQRLFMPKDSDPADPATRQRYGTLCGGVGVACNIFLFALKFIIGMLTASVSITADAFNNLSDCLSSLISIVGFCISGKAADKEHPFGHGRTEYIAGLIVAFLILLVGFEFVRTSFDKILNPQPVNFSWVLLILLCSSLLVKLWMGAFNRTIGKKIDSPVLMAAMQDSINDVVTTSVVILGMIAGKFVSFPLDGYVGLGVAVFIIYSGTNIAKDTLSPLMGEAADPAIAQKLEQEVLQTPCILGVHDLIVHSYGAGKTLASLHAEVPANGDLIDMHEQIDAAERRTHEATGVYLVIHMDPVLIGDERTDTMKEHTLHALAAIDPALCMHDFRVVDGKRQINLIFDLIVPFTYKTKDLAGLKAQIQALATQHDERYNCIIQIDRPM